VDFGGPAPACADVPSFSAPKPLATRHVSLAGEFGVVGWTAMLFFDGLMRECEAVAVAAGSAAELAGAAPLVECGLDL
jgi:hypothetical protein